MGTFRTGCRVTNVVQRDRSADVPELLVDTGSEYTWAPATLLEGLGIAREKKDLEFVMANGQRITRSVGFAIIHVESHFTVDEVVFAEPGDLLLLGARTLEGLNLALDARQKKLVAAGPLPAAPAPTAVGADRLADSPNDYRRIIRRLIAEHAQTQPSVGDVQVETIFDETNDHYELIYAGWDGHRRIHGSALHLDIRGGKVWIQHDGTYDGIAGELVEAGIPRDRIVLAFKPPEIRPHTGFATA